MKKHAFFCLACLAAALSVSAKKPNILFILADDMGYGDVQILNPNSKSPPPTSIDWPGKACPSPMPAGAATDSYGFLHLLKGHEKDHRRPPVINHSAGGMFALREGQWKLVLGNGSGERQVPKGKPFQKPYHLFDPKDDLAETFNLVEKEKEVAQQLEKLFQPIHRKEVRH